MDSYDVVVIGGGAAGLAGALALGRSRRSVLVVDSGEPRNAPAGHVHNYLGREGTPPAELLGIGRAEVEQYGVELSRGVVTAVERAEPSDGASGFAVRLADGRTVRARRILVATGVVDVLPDLPGIAEGWGRTVLHCPYCHGWEVRDQAIGVLGTNPLVLHQTMLFRQLTDDVVLFLHAAPALSDAEREQLDARDVRVVEGPVAAWAPDGVRLASGDLVPRQVLVVSSRLAARAEMLAPLGLHPEPFEVAGFVVADRIAISPTGATSVPGVWAAGNVAEPMLQVIGSAASGLAGGAQLNADLAAEDARLAVERLR